MIDLGLDVASFQAMEIDLPARLVAPLWQINCRKGKVWRQRCRLRGAPWGTAKCRNGKPGRQIPTLQMRNARPSAMLRLRPP